jgi:hypothetical protein
LAGRDRGGGKYLVYRKSAPFAGCRKNVDLGRLVTCAAVPPRRAGSPMTKGALRTPRRGTSSVHAQKCVGNRYEGVATHSHEVTRPLLGPKARTRQSWLNAPAGNRRAVTRSQQHRGRANPRKWEEPAPRLTRTDGARLDACRRSPQGNCAVREKRKTVAAVVPSRSRESGSKCSHVVAVAEVVRRRLASNTLVRSAPKRVAVRVNGGLARGHCRR